MKTTTPQPGDMHANRPEWMHLIQAVADTGTTRGLPRPPAGLADGSKYRMPTYATAKALYRRAVVYSVNGKETTLGYFHTDQLLARVPRPPKPITTEGEIVYINSERTGNMAYPVRVCIDDSGQPAPLPLEYWKRLRALSLASHLLDGAEQSWPIDDVYRFLQNDGWTWTGRDWKEVKMDPIRSDTDWLLVIPPAALPPGIGTISVNLYGIYVEPMEGAGRQVSWPEIAAWIVANESPS